MSKTPASGGATVLSPGRNLATSSDRAPCMESGSTFDSILTNERRWFAPCARHDKLRQGLAAARRHLRLSQVFGQPVGITRVADGERGNRFPSHGNLKHFPRLVGVEPGHLVYC